MAYDTELAERIREALGEHAGLTEKRMFGGVAFMINGNMCCGVTGQDLMVRLDPDRTAEALREPHTAAFDMTGRPMKGWLVVKPAGVAAAADLSRWVRTGLDFAATLPPK
jgi:hypothetical protein